METRSNALGTPNGIVALRTGRDPESLNDATGFAFASQKYYCEHDMTKA